jgi:hypothetical protein
MVSPARGGFTILSERKAACVTLIRIHAGLLLASVRDIFERE